MKRIVSWSGVAIALLVLTACGTAPTTELVEFERELLGSNEVPPVVTPASGTVDVRLRDDELRVQGSFAGLEADLLEVGGASAHIHRGAPGETGPVVFPLDVDAGADARSGTFSFTETLTAEQQADFEAGLYYVNVHTEAHPGGELRAQLHEEAPAEFDQLIEVALSGEAEVPPVTTDASGSAVVALEGDTLSVSGSYEGVTATAAHVHGPAGPDANADVLFPLDVQDGTFSGEFTLTDQELGYLNDGLLYINVHSAANPGGEIRGQIVPAAE